MTETQSLCVIESKLASIDEIVFAMKTMPSRVRVQEKLLKLATDEHKKAQHKLNIELLEKERVINATGLVKLSKELLTKVESI